MVPTEDFILISKHKIRKTSIMRQQKKNKMTTQKVKPQKKRERQRKGIGMKTWKDHHKEH